MDDVIVSIAIVITELYGQLSGKRVVLCITKAVKRSSLVFGNKKYVHLPGMLFMILELPSQISPCRWLKKLEKTNRYTACYGFFAIQRGLLHALVTKPLM